MARKVRMVVLALRLHEMTAPILTSRSILPPGKALNTMKKSDFGLFGAAWWPHATLEDLKILTSFSVWVSRDTCSL
jgi:hypothetical protein